MITRSIRWAPHELRPYMDAYRKHQTVREMCMSMLDDHITLRKLLDAVRVIEHDDGSVEYKLTIDIHHE